MKRKSIPKRIKNVTIEQLYKETKKQVEETNRALKRLEKGTDINRAKYNPKTKRYERQGTYIVTYASGKTVKMKPSNIISYKRDSFAGKTLRNNIATINSVSIKNGRIVIPKNISKMDLSALHKATSNFLKHKHSTIKGINETKKLIKDNLKSVIEEDVEINLTDSETETLYNFFEDKDFNYVKQYFDPSELFIMLTETVAEGGDANDFLRKIENYIYSDSLYKDEDLVESLTNIYNKFVGK